MHSWIIYQNVLIKERFNRKCWGGSLFVCLFYLNHFKISFICFCLITELTTWFVEKKKKKVKNESTIFKDAWTGKYALILHSPSNRYLGYSESVMWQCETSISNWYIHYSHELMISLMINDQKVTVSAFQSLFIWTSVTWNSYVTGEWHILVECPCFRQILLQSPYGVLFNLTLTWFFFQISDCVGFSWPGSHWNINRLLPNEALQTDCSWGHRLDQNLPARLSDRSSAELYREVSEAMVRGGGWGGKERKVPIDAPCENHKYFRLTNL